MPSRLLSTLSLLSLSLGAAVVLACARSHHAWEGVLRQTAGDLKGTQFTVSDVSLGYHEGNLVLARLDQTLTFTRAEGAAISLTELNPSNRYRWMSNPSRTSSVPPWRWLGAGFDYANSAPMRVSGTYRVGHVNLNATSILSRTTSLRIPLWSLAVLFLILPVAWLAKRAAPLRKGGFAVIPRSG